MKNIFGEYAEHEAETTGTIDGIVKTAQGKSWTRFIFNLAISFAKTSRVSQILSVSLN